jgi:pimeloyl-ACP methyl ester carboxylesterase
MMVLLAATSLEGRPYPAIWAGVVAAGCLSEPCLIGSANGVGTGLSVTLKPGDSSWAVAADGADWGTGPIYAGRVDVTIGGCPTPVASPPMEPTTGYATLDEDRIAYQIIGDGPVDLVVTAGWLSPFDIEWEEPNVRAFFQQLARFARVIRFDRRGMGASDPIPLDALPPWESLSDEIEAVMETVGSEQAAVLASGNAAPGACMFAASHPERTSGLVLFNTTVRWMWDDDYPFGYAPEEHAAWSAQAAEDWGTGASLAAAFPSRAGDPAFTKFYARVERATTSPKVIAKYFAAEAEMDGRAVLPTITVPTLVLHRTGSQSVPIEHGRYMAEHIPNARLVELPGGDIVPYWETPELIVEEIERFISGSQPSAAIDRQLATVMFTDIVDSTRRAAALGDRRWQALLDRHHEITRHTVGEYSGQWIRSTGDGMLATFSGPGRAIIGATSLVGEIADIDLHLRTGIHTGEIEIRGNDVGGIAVHLAARIMAEAQADEILVSRTVKDLVVGSDLSFTDRGVHSLKGIDEDWHLYAVTT